MGTLTPNQVLFVLRALGKGLPGESFVESFIEEINCPLGDLVSAMAIEYQLDYEGEKSVLRNPPLLDVIRLKVETVGMRIPNIYRVSSTTAMEYLEKYGSEYLSFSSASNLGHLNNWLGLPTGNRMLVNTPTFSENDPYLNIYLNTHLRDLCTDFDLYKLFPSLLAKATKFQTRKEIIDYLVSLYRPVNDFWISFGFGNLVLTHNNVQYDNPVAIKTFVSTLSLIGLYQLAFLLRPGYVKFIYGIDVTQKVSGIMRDLYQYLTTLIKRFESEGRPKLRFGKEFQEFNQDLDT